MAIGLAYGATTYQDSRYNSFYDKSNAFDTRFMTNEYWASTATPPPHWLAIDLGEGNEKAATRAIVYPEDYGGIGIKDFKIQGSNNATDGSDGDWVDLYSDTYPSSYYMMLYKWTNTMSYRWYRLYITSTYISNGICQVCYLDLFNDDFYPIMPFMTANNAPSPLVVSADFTEQSGYGYYKAFDNNPSSYVRSASGTPSGIIAIDTGETGEERYIVNNYIIGPGDTVPNNWTFQGSNDGVSWTVLDTQVDVTYENYRYTKSFPFTNTTKYRYYKFDISTDSTYLSFNIIQLYGYEQSEGEASEGILFACFI